MIICFQVGLDVMPDDDNERVPILAWNTCAYTIQVTGKSYCMIQNDLTII